MPTTTRMLIRLALPVILTAAIAQPAGHAHAGSDAGPARTGKVREPLEWRFDNTGHKGNPFDLCAKVTFRHEKGATIATEMFHVGGDAWTLRFTPTRPGKWTFTTACDDPDPRTFEAIEMLIRKVHAAGGMVHLWAWGDESRAMTPIRLGGKDGPADRRLQRYVAARLGPIPGWTMGYGFDLDEWVKAPDLRGWHGHLHSRLGWRHLLGGRSVGPNRYRKGVTFPQIWEGLDYSGYEQHRPTYEAYCAAIDARPGRPAFSEDRFRIRQGGYPGKDYDMAMTRRGLWHSALAGGLANIWGRLDGRSSRLGSKPYERPEWIKTWATFFRGRFLRDMARRNAITDGACLARPTKADFVFYKEDAAAVRMDLRGMAGKQPAVAVDAMKPYKEIDLGTLDAVEHTWRAPRKSDWAVAVGRFGAKD